MSAPLGFGGTILRTSQPLPKDRRVYLCDGREVLINLVCTKCHRSKPLSAFGLRRMPDGSIRSIPQCRWCRGSCAAKAARHRLQFRPTHNTVTDAHLAAAIDKALASRLKLTKTTEG